MEEEDREIWATMNNAIISILLVITIAVPLWFDGHIYSVFDLSKITILYILTFGLVAVWAIRGFHNKPPAVYIPKQKGIINIPGGLAYTIPSHIIQGKASYMNQLLYPILAILASTVISTAFAVNPYMSFAGTYKRYGGLVSTVVYMVLFFAVVEFVNRDRIKMFINVIILTACVSAVYGVLQYFGIDPYNWTTNFGFGQGIRYASTFGHPMFFGAYMAMTLSLVLYGILQGNKWMYPVAGLLMYAMFLSKTRAAFVGMIVALIYFFVLYRHRISYKVIGLILAVIIGLSIVMPGSPIKRFGQDLKGWKPRASIAERIRVGMTTLDIIRDYPLFGVGLDCLGTKYATYYEIRYKEVCKGNSSRAHNAVLNILVEQGVLGLLAWLYIIVIYFREVLANREDPLVVALSSGVVAYTIQNLFSFGGVGITPLFWMLMGMTVVAVKNDRC